MAATKKPKAKPKGKAKPPPKRNRKGKGGNSSSPGTAMVKTTPIDLRLNDDGSHGPEAPHPGGRPTKYDPSFCEKIIKWAKEEGMGKTEWAVELGVARSTLYKWADDYPEFSDAFTRAEEAAQAWWEKVGRQGLIIPGFNASLWNKNMSCRFPNEWREDHLVTSRDETPLSLEGMSEEDVEILRGIALRQIAARRNAGGKD